MNVVADEDARVGEDRCWPCTVANAAAGLLVALVPVAVAGLRGHRGLLLGAGVWALLVVAFTVHHLLRRGYLPGAGRVARRTGLHDRVGPGRPTGDGEDAAEAGDGAPEEAGGAGDR